MALSHTSWPRGMRDAAQTSWLDLTPVNSTLEPVELEPIADGTLCQSVPQRRRSWRSSQRASMVRTSMVAAFTEAAFPTSTSEAVKPKKKKKPLTFWMAFLALALCALITSWDATSLAIALPTITEQLNGTTFQSFWAQISFILGVAISQPIYVSISDVLGRRTPLYTSMLFFAVGSTVFATAKSINVLIGGRFLQGLGAGGLDVLEEIILADITSLKERPLYLGFLAMPIATGTIMGPIVGAIFSEYVDWRWIGWINLPFVGIAFVLAFFFLKLRAIPMPFGDKIRRLDGIGMVLYSTGAAAIALPLSWADSLYSWGSWRTLVPLSIGLIVIAIFIWYERRPAEAIMPYRLFKSITTTASLATGFIHGLILYTMLFYLPLFFQAVFLETPLNAAKSTLPVAIVVVLFSILAPITIELTRRYRLLLWSGWISITAFLGVWIIVDRQTKRVEAYAFQALLGIGVGVVFTGTQVPVQASVAHVDDVGLAVGMLVVFRLLGALIGQAAASTLFNTIFSKSIKDLGVLPDALTILEDASQAVGFIPALRTLDIDERTFDRVIGVYMKSFRAIWIFVTVWAAVGIFCSLFIKELALESEETGRQGFVTLENINEERV